MTPHKIILLYLLTLMSVTGAQNYNSNPEGKFNFQNYVGEIANNNRFPRRSSNENYNIQTEYGRNHQGIIGPVHTFVKTDKDAHFKWGVRHYVDQGHSEHH